MNTAVIFLKLINSYQIAYLRLFCARRSSQGPSKWKERPLKET